jgi:hypothetical protein
MIRVLPNYFGASACHNEQAVIDKMIPGVFAKTVLPLQ